MKNKFITFLLVILMIFLIGGIGLFGYMIYLDLSTEDTALSFGDESSTNMVALEEPQKKQKKIAETISDIFGTEENNINSYSAKSSDGKYYYEQLDDTEKTIYNGLQENKDKLETGNYVIKYGNKFSDILSKQDGNKTLGDKYQAAIDAFTTDNPDLFYIDISKLYLNIETSKKPWSTTYNVYIGPENGNSYYSTGFTSEEQVKNAISQIEQIRDLVLSKMTNSDYKNVKLIHDYLVQSISYDENYQNENTYTIYGALIDNKCVCEGYAKAFKYLANAAGIDCEIVKGTALNSSGQSEKHAWNCVKLNNIWYNIDVTWDDPVIIDGSYRRESPTVSHEYFLKGETTFRKDHVVEYYFSTNGKKFSYPEISKNDY